MTGVQTCALPISIVILENMEKKVWPLTWFSPFVFAFALFSLAELTSFAVLKQMNHKELFGINVLLSLIFVAALHIVGFYRRNENTKLERLSNKEYAEEFKEVEQLSVNPEDLGKYIASIEDKSKALNFAIGRVYGKRHGGSKEMRELIKIKSEWYNEFSNIDKNDQVNRYGIARKLIERILAVLNKLELKENEVFEQFEARNLKRSVDGSDKIIDVLVANENDPVQTYYESAIEFCNKAKDALKKLGY